MNAAELRGGAIVVALNLVGWAALFAQAVSAPAVIAIGVASFALGMRHAFDADHIAAIDNTTRRLLAEKRSAGTVGLWFSLGHSTVVVLLCVALALGISALGSQISDENSPLHAITSFVGPTVAGVFLLLIGAVNAVAVLRLVRRRRSRIDAPVTGGPVTRTLDRLGRVIRRPHQMYFVGFLFGLGFDTATEIGLLGLVGSASATALPWYAILTLPVLFAAGMSLLDTLQGLVARRAYSAGERPAGYDLLLGVTTVAVALVIGTISLCGALSRSLGVGGPIAAVGGIDLGWVGFALTGVLVVAWVVVLLGSRTLTRRRLMR